jgi:NAD(P)-dependent dehydrogenase (short-subunit alcohol dehydrogenase family)
VSGSTTHDVVLITGAAGDIGFAAAQRLATPDRSLALADHPTSADKLADRAAQLRSHGHHVVEVLFDVCDRAAVGAAIDSIVESAGLPTLVFNNAGYQGSFARVGQLLTSDVERVLAVNVVGAFNVIAETSERMIQGDVDGAIVNSASMAGVGGAPNMAAYSASKAAVIGLTKSAAKDLAPFGIRVNAISPAFIGPGMMWERQVELQAAANSQYFSTDPAKVARQMIGSVPMRRFGSLDEVASVVEFLLSPNSSYLTGNNIEVSGGSA